MHNLNQYLIPEKKAIIWADEQDEELSFAPESTPPPLQSEAPWKILLVDDEVEIHQVTKLALHDFTFEGKSLTFLSAY